MALVACGAVGAVGWLTGWVISLVLLVDEWAARFWAAVSCGGCAELVVLLLEVAVCVLVFVAGVWVPAVWFCLPVSLTFSVLVTAFCVLVCWLIGCSFWVGSADLAVAVLCGATILVAVGSGVFVAAAAACCWVKTKPHTNPTNVVVSAILFFWFKTIPPPYVKLYVDL